MQQFSMVYNNLFVFLEPVDEPRPTYDCGQLMQGSSTGGDSDSPISIVPHLKLTSMLILNEPYSIEKCAKFLDIFSKILELTVCRIRKINEKVYTLIKNMS